VSKKPGNRDLKTISNFGYEKVLGTIEEDGTELLQTGRGEPLGAKARCCQTLSRKKGEKFGRKGKLGDATSWESLQLKLYF